MDKMRGVYLPLLFLAMAGLLLFLGQVSSQDSQLLASRAQGLSTPAPADLAPRAEAEARRRDVLKRAHAASTEALSFFGCAGLLLAGAGLLFVTHLRYFRAADGDLALAYPQGQPPSTHG